MKLNDLRKAAAKAQLDFQLAQRKAADLQQKAKAAKARSEDPASSISARASPPDKRRRWPRPPKTKRANDAASSKRPRSDWPRP